MKNAAGALLFSIQIDRDSKVRMSVQLYAALREIILSGGLRAGERLPATRVLSQETGVSRTTVVDAIDRLVSEGMLEARVGAGTFVADTLEKQRPQMNIEPAEPMRLPKPKLTRSLDRAGNYFTARDWLPHRAGAFVTAIPALDAFPMGNWSRISSRHLRAPRSMVMGYGEPKGYAPLRAAIATHLSALKGISCDPEQIFITCGAQHAFSLIGRLFLNSGDKVWIENPGASGARNAFLSEGAKLVPVNVDAEGINVADGQNKAPDFRLAFVTPSHQQPLGVVMSLARRFALLQAAADAQAIIVEDDYDGEFYFGNAPQPALRSIDTNERVIYVGTFSRSLFPSLRLGFAAVPKRMVDSFDKVFSYWASGPATATQAIVADFINEGHFATHIRMMRRLYKARYETLIDASQSLKGAIDIQPTTNGFHVPAFTVPGIDEHKVISEAAQKNIRLVPLSRYCMTPIPQRGFVLGFGSARPEEIRKSAKVVSQLPEIRKKLA